MSEQPPITCTEAVAFALAVNNDGSRMCPTSPAA
jgi:hypothetical protein